MRGRTLMAMGIGAAVMYLFDPENGRERREMLRERLMETNGPVIVETAEIDVEPLPATTPMP